jgi:hypothetical protein
LNASSRNFARSRAAASRSRFSGRPGATVATRTGNKPSEDRRNGKALTRELSAIVPKGRLAECGDDCYETPPEAVWALLEAERIPTMVWEPACAIALVLRARLDASCARLTSVVA